MDLLGAGVGEQPPLVQEDQSVAGAVDLAEVVRGEQHGGAAGGVLFQEGEHRAAARRVQALGGLVQQAHPQPWPHGRRQQELPFHAVAVPVDPGPKGQPELLGEGPRAAPCLAVAAAQEPLQVLAPAHLAVVSDLSRAVGAAPPHRGPVPAELDPVHRGAARVGAHQADEHAQEGALAAAVGSQQAGDPPRADVGFEGVHRDQRPEPTGQAVDLDLAGGHGVQIAVWGGEFKGCGGEGQGIPAPTGGSCSVEAATGAKAVVSGVLGACPLRGHGLVGAWREAHGIPHFPCPSFRRCGAMTATPALGGSPMDTRYPRGMPPGGRKSQWMPRSARRASRRRRKPMVTPHTRCASRTSCGSRRNCAPGAASRRRADLPRCHLVRALAPGGHLHARQTRRAGAQLRRFATRGARSAPSMWRDNR